MGGYIEKLCMEFLARSAVFSEIIFRAGIYGSAVCVGTCCCMSGASFVWRVTAVLHTNYQLRAKATLASLHCSFPQTVYWEWEQQWVLWCHLQPCVYADGRVSLYLLRNRGL